MTGRLLCMVSALCAMAATAVGQVIDPYGPYREIRWNLSASDGQSPTTHVDTRVNEGLGAWLAAEFPNATAGSASSTAGIVQQSIVRFGYVRGRNQVFADAQAILGTDVADAEAVSEVWVHFFVSDFTPFWIRELGTPDTSLSYIFNEDTQTPVFSFGDGYAEGLLDPGTYSIRVVQPAIAAASGGNAYNDDDTESSFTFVAMQPGCISSFTHDVFTEDMPISTVGDADIDLDSGVLRLTDSLNDQHGAAWYIDKVNVGGGFDTTFTFRITDGWADGLAFLIQNDSPVAIGGAGSEMGYAPGFSRGSQFLPGVSRSVAIEIDTFSGGSEMQTPHISVQTRGAQPNDISDSASIASADLPNPVDGDPHTVRVRYTPGNLEVYFDDVLYIDTPLDLEDINGDNIVDESGCAWLGFTAGTGGAIARQEILSWRLGESCVTEFEITEFDGLSVNTTGSASALLDRVRLTHGEPYDVGAAWYPTTTHLGQGFETQFTFQISGTGDGFAFVLQNEGSTSLGGDGSDLGYGGGMDVGISNSVAIEFDVFGFPGEFPTPHVSVQTNGALENSAEDAYSIAWAEVPGIDDGQPHTARIFYAPPNTFEVYVDGELVLTTELNLEDVLGDNLLDLSGCGYLGFTGASGGAVAVQDILEWGFRSFTCGSPPCTRSIVGWSSRRTHHEMAYDIALNPDAIVNPTTEPRAGGLQEIVIEFDGDIDVIDPFAITIMGRTTVDGVLQPPVQYFPPSMAYGGSTVSMYFPLGTLPDQTCYQITVQREFMSQILLGNRTVHVRALEGDTNSNGVVNLGDALLVRQKYGQDAASLPEFDVNLSDTPIDFGDAAFIKTRIASPPRQALCEW